MHPAVVQGVQYNHTRKVKRNCYELWFCLNVIHKTEQTLHTTGNIALKTNHAADYRSAKVLLRTNIHLLHCQRFNTQTEL